MLKNAQNNLTFDTKTIILQLYKHEYLCFRLRLYILWFIYGDNKFQRLIQMRCLEKVNYDLGTVTTMVCCFFLWPFGYFCGRWFLLNPRL